MHWPHFLDDKALVALLSVATGWALGQGTTLLRDYWKSFKLKKALLQELEDIYEQLQRVQWACRRNLQFYALGGIEPATPQSIPNFFFKHYYKDVFDRLNREQRLSYQLIHGTIDSLNAAKDDLLKFTLEAGERVRGDLDDDEVQKAVEIWGDKVKALFLTTNDAVFYVDYHLRHKRHPGWSFKGPIHKEYLQFCEKVGQEIEGIVKATREKLTREDLQKPFDEKQFPPDGGKD